MRVAVLGTGKMGAAIARRLGEMGHDLTLWNRTRSRAEAVGVGKVAQAPEDAVRDADVVISILTDAEAVRGAYLGKNGAVAAAQDQVFVEMSTAGPDVVREVQPALERRGAKFVASPVSGSVAAMQAGKGFLYVAGDDAAVERARPVLEALGEIHRVSDAETAAKLKLIANTTLTVISALAAEMLAAGRAAGVEPEEVFSVLTRFAPNLNNRRAGFLEHRFEPVTFALRDALKDLRLATEVYRNADALTPITDATRKLYDEAAKTSADLDMSAIAVAYEPQPAAQKSS